MPSEASQAGVELLPATRPAPSAGASRSPLTPPAAPPQKTLPPRRQQRALAPPVTGCRLRTVIRRRRRYRQARQAAQLTITVDLPAPADASSDSSPQSARRQAPPQRPRALAPATRGSLLKLPQRGRRRRAHEARRRQSTTSGGEAQPYRRLPRRRLQGPTSPSPELQLTPHIKAGTARLRRLATPATTPLPCIALTDITDLAFRCEHRSKIPEGTTVMRRMICDTIAFLRRALASQRWSDASVS